MKKAKTPKKKGPFVQRHHISYPPEEIVVMVWKAEHKVLSEIQWYTKLRVSKGFLNALSYFISENHSRAVDIPFPPPKQKKTKTFAKRIPSDARALAERGYEERECAACEGHGWVEHDAGGGNAEKAYCTFCMGKGFIRVEV